MAAVEIDETVVSRQSRLLAIDALRGLAVILMIIYHGAWDLAVFGLAPFDMMAPGWLWFSYVILGSFLALSGFNQMWGWRHGVQSRKVLRRTAKIAAAAAAVTVGTYLVYPEAYVFFGVLHHIALASLILLVLRSLPLPALLLLAGGVLVLPHFAVAEFFNAPILLWLGLTPYVPISNDYVPIAPWFAMMLMGAALGLLARRHVSKTQALLAWPSLNAGLMPLALLAWAGRHSLVIYLLHQPVIWGGIYGWLFLSHGL